MKDSPAALVWYLILAVCAFGAYAFVLIALVAVGTIAVNDYKEKKGIR